MWIFDSLTVLWVLALVCFTLAALLSAGFVGALYVLGVGFAVAALHHSLNNPDS